MITLRWETLAIMVPRFCLVALSVSQPFLINSAVNFLQTPEDKESNSVGYGLIGGFSFVYIGTAVSPREIHPIEVADHHLGNDRVVPAP
jgi:ATP-binding cassette subfamily C (CFTR/MRP) protein 1